MAAYLSRRALQAVAVVLLVTLILFALISQAPGGAAAALGASAAHEQFLVQYFGWLGRVLQGNLGYSTRLNQSVGSLLAASLPRTLALTLTATVLALLVAVPLGLIQAVRRGAAVDHGLRVVTYAFFGTPTVVLGPVLILFLAIDARIFGPVGPQSAGFLGVITNVQDMTLPVLTLALVTIAIFARYMRSSAMDSLAQEYVEAARARGAGQRRVLTSHVLRNSLVPVVTLLGLGLPQILGGAVVVEIVFNIQGMGWQLYQATTNHDYAVTLGFTLVISVGAVLGSVLADIGYAALDPRVRLAQT
jgi:peptide/nickel transport system permease protein